MRDATEYFLGEDHALLHSVKSQGPTIMPPPDPVPSSTSGSSPNDIPLSSTTKAVRENKGRVVNAQDRDHARPSQPPMSATPHTSQFSFVSTRESCWYRLNTYGKDSTSGISNVPYNLGGVPLRCWRIIVYILCRLVPRFSCNSRCL